MRLFIISMPSTTVHEPQQIVAASTINDLFSARGFRVSQHSSDGPNNFEGQIWFDENGIEVHILEDGDCYQIMIYTPVLPVSMEAANSHWGFAALNGKCGKAYKIQMDDPDVQDQLLSDIKAAHRIIELVSNHQMPAFCTAQEVKVHTRNLIAKLLTVVALYPSAPWIAAQIQEAIYGSGILQDPQLSPLIGTLSVLTFLLAATNDFDNEKSENK